jgi:Na+/glutamate symporter
VLAAVDALVAALVVTLALTLSSLDRRSAVLLGATGSVTGEFLTWVAAPHAWEHSLLLPWVAAVAGTVLLVAGWSAARAYWDVFESPGAPEDTDTASFALAGDPDRSHR